MKEYIREWTRLKFANKYILWSKYLKIYTDNGQPIFTWVPHFTIQNFAKYWGLKGFNVQWLGRIFYFVFDNDINGYY